MVVIDNDFASLWYHPQKQIVHHQFHRFIYGQGFQEVLLAGLHLMTENNASKWLSDDRALPVLRREDMDWAHNEWFPRMVEAGWKFWAIVQPEKVIGQMNIERVVREYLAAGITAKYFSDPDDAMKWLENQ